MNHLKVCVYAICKNEQAHIPGWLTSMAEADAIVVLDTGSTDASRRLLREQGATVYEDNFSPFRFDVARNRSLALLPDDTDICVCTDPDERFSPGWREAIEAVWAGAPCRVRCRYRRDHRPQALWATKIHSRHRFRWVNPTQEELHFDGDGCRTVTADNICLTHYGRRASPSERLPLLELAAAENTSNARLRFYLGELYWQQQEWQKSVAALNEGLRLAGEQSTNSVPYDLASLGYYYAGDYMRALHCVNEAINRDPTNKRLKKNRAWILKSM